MIQSAWDYIWNNFLVIWGILGTLGTAYGFYVSRREKDLESMPEFELKGVGFSTNGRKFRLINKSKIMVRVLELKIEPPELIDYAASTDLNWDLDDNENNFYIQVRGRGGDLKFDIIFENKLRRKYIQTINFVSGIPEPSTGSKWSITRAKRKYKFLII